MDYEGMEQMFKALESSGLRGFLSLSSAIYESALLEFFQNASVRDGKVVSTVQGKAVEITEEVFAGTFELPTEGLTEMTDVPKDLVFYAWSAFSMSGEQLKTSCKKREIKYEFCLLNDILAKTVTVKAGSFDAVTHERAAPAEKKLMMVPVVQDPEPISSVPAVTPKAQLRRAPKRKLVLQKGSDDEIVDSIIHQVIGDTTTIETGEPDLGETDLEEPVVVENSETTAVETESMIDVPAITNYDEDSSLKVLSNEEGVLDMFSDADQVALEKLSKQMREHNLEWMRPITSRVFEGAERDRGEVIARSNTNIIATCWIRRLLKMDGSWKIVEDCCRWIPMNRKTIYYEKQQPYVANFAPIYIVTVGPVVDTSGVSKRAVNNVQYDIRIVDSLSVLPDPVAEEPVVHIKTDPTDSPLHFTTDDIPFGDEKTTDALSTDFTSEVHIEKLKAAIFTKISSLESAFLARSETQDRAVLVNNDVLRKEIKAQKEALPQEMDIFRKEVQDQKAALSNDLMEFREQAQENYNTLTTQLSELVDYINRGGDAKKGEMSSSRGPPPPEDQKRSGGSSRSEPPKKRGGGSQSSSSKGSAFLARSETQDRAVLVNNDVLRKEIKAQKEALSQEMDIFRKEVQDQKAALSNDLMEFREQAQENYNTLTTQLSELVDYINRGGDAKKGEMSSSRGPPPPEDQKRSGGSSRSEPPKKRGGGSQSSSRQRGFRYWLG
ncbi:mucin-2-like [Dorcoceras hygrometricum]|uniref:Mucin-2-like n=1 Tax=Dorcoceras hygrometricum TaxID=472368 RepID=A0A2Z7BR65_9LAMI|nr:mucin-2-like [Dorcoceras hygrometricum]